MIVDTTSVDLTGIDPNFKRNDLRYMVFKGEQFIYFHEPIYAESIVVYLVTSAGIEEDNPLVKNVDYVIPTGDSELVADDAISDAKICFNKQGLTFDKNIVKGIKITRAYTSDYQIQVRGQAFYRQVSDYIGKGEGPDYSRALMASVIERITHLEKIKNPMDSVLTTDISTIKPLDEDLTGAASDNFIQMEAHEVDTLNNKYAIRPVYGTFYDTADLKVVRLVTEYRTVVASDIGNYVYDATKSVKVLLTAENISEYLGTIRYIEIREELTRYDETTDTGYYVVRGIDHGRTRIAHTSAGVFDRILIVKPMKATVEITYHAFGGEVTIKDIYALKHGLISLYSNLGNGNYVTEDAIPSHPTIAGLESRLSNVEDIVHLVRPSEFDYTCKFQTVTDASSKSWNVPRELWVNVATLYKKSWTEISGPPMQHAEEFCMESESQNYCVYFTLKYDLSTNKLFIDKVRAACKSLSSYGYNYFDERKVPKFRIVYISGKLTKGIVLQMTITAPAACENPWQFRAVNTANSSWNVIPADGQLKEETTYMTVLPDNATVWYVGGSVSTRVNGATYAVGDKVFYPNKTGYILVCKVAGTAAATLPSWPTETTTLVDGTVTWQIMEASVGSETNTTPLSNPYTVFSGNIPMSLIDAESYREGTITTGTGDLTTYQDEPGKVELEGFYVRTIKEEDAFSINDIKGFRFHIFDRYIGKMIVQNTASVSLTTDNNVSGELVYYPLDLCTVECKVTKLDYGMFKVAIKAHTGLHSIMNERFDFRQLDFLFEEGEV